MRMEPPRKSKCRKKRREKRCTVEENGTPKEKVYEEKEERKECTAEENGTSRKSKTRKRHKGEKKYKVKENKSQ